eukprot:12992-Heterococcus_DN1.PRE.3
MYYKAYVILYHATDSSTVAKAPKLWQSAHVTATSSYYDCRAILAARVRRKVVVQVDTNTMVFLSLPLLQLCGAQSDAVSLQQQDTALAYNSYWQQPQHALSRKFEAAVTAALCQQAYQRTQQYQFPQAIITAKLC